MSKKDWQLQLQDPTGKVWALGSMGYASSTPELSYVLNQVKEYLQSGECTWSGKEFVLVDVYQTLLNRGFHPYHNFRLVWGRPPVSRVLTDCNPYPDGCHTNWHLCYESNGRVQICTSGSLPDGWWDLDEAERCHRLQNLM